MAAETKKERNIQNLIRLEFGHGDCRLFTNDQGLAMLPDGSTIRYGLGKGTSDLVGFKQVTITPEMVGKKIAVATFLEVKSEKGRVTPEQQSFINKMVDLGCIAGVVRSITCVKILFDSYKKSLQK